MPSKNIEVRRATHRKWLRSKRVKGTVAYEKDLIRRLAAQHYRVREACSIAGCTEVGERHHPDYSKPLDIVWLCKQHHELEHHKAIRVCKIEECNLKHHAHGYCNRHMKKFLRGTL